MAQKGSLWQLTNPKTTTMVNLNNKRGHNGNFLVKKWATMATFQPYNGPKR